MEDEGLKIPRTKIFLVFVSVALKFYCQLSGVLSQQGELAIMNSLGVINSIRDWLNFNWQHQVDEISKLPLSQENSNPNYEEFVKTVLKWVVMTRVIIAHLYTATYIANFYPILTLCRGKLLVPWLAMSAVKNFILEVIVLVVVVLLYLQNHLSIYLLCEFFIHKLLTLAPAVYNWLTINTFYMELKTLNRRKLARPNTSMFSRKSSIVYKHPNIIMGLPMQSITFNPSSEAPKRVSSLINYHHPSNEPHSPVRFTKSLSWNPTNKRETDFFITKNSKSTEFHLKNHHKDISQASTSSCECPITDDPEEFTISSSKSTFLPQDWFLKKINNKLSLREYTNLLNQYNDTESSRWSSDEEISAQESFTTIINKNVSKSQKTSKQSTKIDSNQWRRRLEIIGSSFESTIQYYNQSYDHQSFKISSNDVGLSRSWILDGMIITGTVNSKNLSNGGVEIEALKAYNKKTLWKDRLKHQKFDEDGEKSKDYLSKLSRKGRIGGEEFFREKNFGIDLLKNDRLNLQSENIQNESSEEFEIQKNPVIIHFPIDSSTHSIRRAIASLDWSLKSFPPLAINSPETNWQLIKDENDSLVVDPVPDNMNNTVESLLFAFGFSDTISGFDFGSTFPMYSLPEEIPNVFNEIIKTARVRTIKHDCNCRSTADVDYGEKYWSNAEYIT